MNAALRALFDADQADRRPGHELDLDTMRRDRERRRRLRDLLADGLVVDGADHYHAAMLLQHGGSQECYRRARELALRAVELGHRPARLLAAAALDRLLVRQGRRQKYGTQYRIWGDEQLLFEVDPATTDEERALWDVRPLAAALEDAGGMIPPDPVPPVVVGGVEVLVQRMGPDRAGSGQAAAEPLVEPADPLPWLPEGVHLTRSGPGVGAVATSGSRSVAWIPLPMSHDESVVIGWTDELGTPNVEVVEVAGGTAALVESDVSGMRWLVRPLGSDWGWLLVGELSREDILRVASSLPADGASGTLDVR